ncbi:MAG: hypothetical protein Q9170_004993 [Blastenia crenularia]
MRTGRKLAIYFMIVVITGLRISAIYDLNSSDITYTSPHFALYNVLETLLGVFNSCLPVTRPIFQMLFEKSSLLGSKGSHDSAFRRGAGTRRNLYQKFKRSKPRNRGSDKDSFQELHDDRYGLSNIATATNETSIGTPVKTTNSTDLEEQLIDSEQMKPLDRIKVTRAWDVVRTSG